MGRYVTHRPDHECIKSRNIQPLSSRANKAPGIRCIEGLYGNRKYLSDIFYRNRRKMPMTTQKVIEKSL